MGFICSPEVFLSLLFVLAKALAPPTPVKACAVDKGLPLPHSPALKGNLKYDLCAGIPQSLWRTIPRCGSGATLLVWPEGTFCPIRRCDWGGGGGCKVSTGCSFTKKHGVIAYYTLLMHFDNV